MATTSTPALSLDGPVPGSAPSFSSDRQSDWQSNRQADLQMAASAPLVRAETGADRLLRTIGSAMIGAGALAMLGGAIAGSGGASSALGGSIVAAAIFTIIMGLAIRFPTMLQDGSMTDDRRPAYSCTRVVTLLVVGSFVLLTVKVGWTTGSLDGLKIDQSWALVLGVVLGGKVVQGLSEMGAGPSSKK